MILIKTKIIKTLNKRKKRRKIINKNNNNNNKKKINKKNGRLRNKNEVF